MNRKGLPAAQDALEVIDEIFFANGFWHGEQQSDVRLNQINLGIVSPSKLIDSLSIKIWVMNSRKNQLLWTSQHCGRRTASSAARIYANGIR